LSVLIGRQVRVVVGPQSELAQVDMVLVALHPALALALPWAADPALSLGLARQGRGAAALGSCGIVTQPQLALLLPFEQLHAILLDRADLPAFDRLPATRINAAWSVAVRKVPASSNGSDFSTSTTVGSTGVGGGT
jgi:hypothetical protein